jgi:drug/metabolite transporter (DMT)-like permease
MSAASSRRHYRLGAVYSAATATLLATQQPFSALAAKHLNPVLFACLTQTALLASVPLLIAGAKNRGDFVAIFLDRRNYWRLGVLVAIGLAGLLFYNASLSGAHPIIIAAILDLSPLAAAAVARLISKKPLPVSSPIFFGCLAAAFIGAMMIAWSQIAGPTQPSLDELVKGLLQTSWIYAIPIPILYALSGTLIGEWFQKFEDAAAVAANFVASAVILIPACLILLLAAPPTPLWQDHAAAAVALLLIGTLASAAAGRVLYQIALTVTKNDNAFVTMFFLLVPGLTTLISIPLSWWLPDLKFSAGPLFFAGLLLVAAPLLFFSVKAWRVMQPQHAPALSSARRQGAI